MEITFLVMDGGFDLTMLRDGQMSLAERVSCTPSNSAACPAFQRLFGANASSGSGHLIVVTTAFVL